MDSSAFPKFVAEMRGLIDHMVGDNAAMFADRGKMYLLIEALESEYKFDMFLAREKLRDLEAVNQMLKQEIEQQKKINLMLESQAGDVAAGNAILRDVPDRMFDLVFDPRVCLLGKFGSQDECRDGGWCLDCWRKLAARARDGLKAELKQETEELAASRGVKNEEYI